MERFLLTKPRGLNMSSETAKNKINIIIWVICELLLIGAFGIPKLYRSYHSAPYYNSTGRTIILENNKEDTHKLNKYQKLQFTKIAKETIDQKDGPFNWKNYKIIYLDIYKLERQSEYALILKIKPKLKIKDSTITSSMIVKLNHSNLINYYDISVIKYSSDFSSIFSKKQ